MRLGGGSTQRQRDEWAHQRRRCPACGRWTVRKRRYLPVPDERCGICADNGYVPRVIDSEHTP